MTLIARHLIIMGRVQDVFFRNWTVDTARDLGLCGWVRNRLDGSVEAQIEGAADAIDAFIQCAHDGPPAAKVSRIDVTDVAVEDLTTFQKRPTA